MAIVGAGKVLLLLLFAAGILLLLQLLFVAIVGAVAALLLLRPLFVAGVLLLLLLLQLLLFAAIILLMLLLNCLFGSACMLTAICSVDRMDDGLRGEVHAALKRAIKKARKGTDILLCEQDDAILILIKFMQYWVAMLQQLSSVDEQELPWFDGMYSIGSMAPDHMKNSKPEYVMTAYHVRF